MVDPELIRLQPELNLASLRAVVHFLDRLQLRTPEQLRAPEQIRPPDGMDSEDQSHVVSRLFIRYFGLILRMIEIGRTEVC